MIRPFRSDETETMIDIWYAASIEAHAFMSPTFWEREKKAIRETYIPLSTSYVYESDGRFVAFISLLDPDEIGALFVHPQWQGRGIGAALIRHAADLRGTLHVEAFKENPRAVSFYEGMGFVRVEEKVEPTTGHPLVRLRRDGAGTAG